MGGVPDDRASGGVEREYRIGIARHQGVAAQGGFRDTVGVVGAGTERVLPDLPAGHQVERVFDAVLAVDVDDPVGEPVCPRQPNRWARPDVFVRAVVLGVEPPEPRAVDGVESVNRLVGVARAEYNLPAAAAVLRERGLVPHAGLRPGPFVGPLVVDPFLAAASGSVADAGDGPEVAIVLFVVGLSGGVYARIADENGRAGAVDVADHWRGDELARCGGRGNHLQGEGAADSAGGRVERV